MAREVEGAAAMDFQMKDLMGAIGPHAALVFAAWIYLSFLQQRYVSAFENYRKLVAEFRAGAKDGRAQNLQDQVRVYRRRCAQMRWATNLGIVSALCLLVTLLSSVLDVLMPQQPAIRLVAAVSVIAGLVLVMAAAFLVLFENSATKVVLDQEVSDLPDLKVRHPDGG
jgi:hypothetical protein